MAKKKAASSETLDQERNRICGPVLKSLEHFFDVDDDDRCAAAVFSALSSQHPYPVTQEDLEEIVTWVNQIKMEVCTLHEFLAGKIHVYMKDGEMMVSLKKPEPTPESIAAYDETP
jgi:hypothetical protein